MGEEYEVECWLLAVDSRGIQTGGGGSFVMLSGRSHGLVVPIFGKGKKMAKEIREKVKKEMSVKTEPGEEVIE